MAGLMLCSVPLPLALTFSAPGAAKSPTSHAHGGMPPPLQSSRTSPTACPSFSSSAPSARRTPAIFSPSRRAAPPRMAFSPLVPFSLACTVPTTLGFWKSEYGVSYAYGTAMLSTGALLLASAPPSRLAYAHAACVAFYGLRLNLFLLWRELTIPRFRDFRDKIEARSTERGGRWKRTPFLLACSGLYLGMASPMVLTARAATAGHIAPLLLVLMYAGLYVAAVGDIWKSAVKAKRGSDVLVTSGPFAILRHPNYTGEFVLWSANAALGVSAAVSSNLVKQSAGWLAASAFGVCGICFVLMQAATSLEGKQAEKYAGEPTYEAWLRRTWAGPTFAKKA